MEPIRIGGNKNKIEIKNMIDKYFLNSKIEIKEKGLEDRFEFIFFLEKTRHFDEIVLYNNLSNLVQDIIVEIYIDQVIKDRVIKICSDYSTSEKKDIVSFVHQMLLDTNNYVKERIKINDEICDYLMEHNSLLIDGYIEFRLRDYLYIIDISIEKAILDLETEKEYMEFLNMLHYFVDIQEPKYDLVNVIVKDDDYIILDLDNNVIEDGLLNDMESELLYGDIGKVDLLISSLIVISPNQLIIHVKDIEKEQQLVDITSEIFKDRVKFCQGCEQCQVNVKLKNGK